MSIQGILAQHGLILHGIRPTRFFFQFSIPRSTRLYLPNTVFPDLFFRKFSFWFFLSNVLSFREGLREVKIDFQMNFAEAYALSLYLERLVHTRIRVLFPNLGPKALNKGPNAPKGWLDFQSILSWLLSGWNCRVLSFLSFLFYFLPEGFLRAFPVFPSVFLWFGLISFDLKQPK